MLKLALTFILFATSAYATEIDFSTVITDLSGKPVVNCPSGSDCKDAPPLTLGEAAVLALTVNLPDQQKAPLDGEEKFKNYMLAQKIYNQGKVDLSPGDIEKVKAAIGKVYASVVVGKAWVLLGQPKDTPEAPQVQGKFRPKLGGPHQ
jgi:hypothetical protein